MAEIMKHKEKLIRIRKKSWRCPTLTWGNPTLSLALSVFTTEFGMGQVGPARYRRQENRYNDATKHTNVKHLHDMVKSFSQLVRVSSTPRSAYTPRLSTSSSSTGFLGKLISREASRLDAFSGYPVRP